MMEQIARLSLAILLLFSVSSFAACTEDDHATDVTEIAGEGGNNGNENEKNDCNGENDMDRNIRITVSGTVFNATLADNATARAFAAMLPVTLEMSELNGNEKYHYLDGNLPTASNTVETIHAGDLMLYGSSCVVLFYETFASGYSYTRIGRVDNPDGLADALGRGSVSVTFEEG